MNLKQVLLETVGVSPSHVKVTSRCEATCVVNKEWLKRLLAEKKVPAVFVHQDHLTDTECQVLLHQPPAALSHEFAFATVIRIAKLENRYAPCSCRTGPLADKGWALAEVAALGPCVQMCEVDFAVLGTGSLLLS